MSQLVQSPTDSLPQALELLRQALAEPALGRERRWAEGVSSALRRVEAELRQHRSQAAEDDGPFAEVDVTRPSLVRQREGLCREQGDLLRQAAALRAIAARCALRPSPPVALIREQAQELLVALQHNNQAETALVLESVTTDIGVGD